MDFSNYLKSCDYEKAYNLMEREHASYDLNTLVKFFPKCNSLSLYTFLMYSISKNETVEKHLAICQCLYFLNPYILDSDSLIRWHAYRAFSIEDVHQKMKSWIIEIYGTNPASPFDHCELCSFARDVCEVQPHNELAHRLLET